MSLTEQTSIFDIDRQPLMDLDVPLKSTVIATTCWVRSALRTDDRDPIIQSQFPRWSVEHANDVRYLMPFMAKGD